MATADSALSVRRRDSITDGMKLPRRSFGIRRLQIPGLGGQQVVDPHAYLRPLNSVGRCQRIMPVRYTRPAYGHPPDQRRATFVD